MEIRDRVLRALERKHEIRESTVRQARIVLNSQTKSHQQVHREKLKTFADLKQAMLSERTDTRRTAGEQMQNILLIKKRLGAQEQEVRMSEVVLSQLLKNEQELIVQHMRINEQQRLIREFSDVQRARVIHSHEDRQNEEIAILSLLPKDSELDQGVVDVPSISQLGHSDLNSPEVLNRTCADPLFESQSSWSQNLSEQGNHQQRYSEPERPVLIDTERPSKRNSESAHEQESDPQLVFRSDDSQGKQVAVAITLRPERGLEVSVQHSALQTQVQSQHEARRIERSLNASGLSVAQVIVSKVDR